MSNLIEQWNDHTIKGNQLSRELEDIESLLDKAQESDICFSSGSNGAVFIRVLSPEKMQELKNSAMDAIVNVRDNKEAELEKLMGMQRSVPIIPSLTQGIVIKADADANVKIVPPDTPEVVIPATLTDRKPATINPDFEAAVQDMVKQSKPTEKSLDKYPAKKAADIYPKNMTVAAVRKLYIDEGKTITQVAKHFNISYSRANNFIYNNNLARSKKPAAEKERP